MKERTDSQRNFLGALLGGIVCVFAFECLHPIALPPSCFLGVIIGWWYQEIWQSGMKEFHKSTVKSQELWNRLTILALKEIKFNTEPYVKVFHSFLSVAIWILRRPIVCIDWLAHPMNRAYITRTLTIIIYVVLNAIWAVPLVAHWLERIKTANEESMAPLLYILCVIIVLMIAILPCILFLEGNKPKIQRFYFDWDRYVTHGPFRFFAEDLIYLFKLEISVIFFGIVKLSWVIGIGGMFVLIIIAPISAVVGAIKGIYHVSTKRRHWLCFGVTITVATILVWFAHPYFNDVHILWTVALSTGIISAVITETIRRSLVWFFDASEKIQAMVMVPLYERLTPAGQKFCYITDAIDDKLVDALPLPN